MFEDARSETLFGTPLSRFLVADYQVLNAELLAEAARLRAESDGVQKSNKGGWHSDLDFLDRDTACIQRLRAAAIEAVKEVTRRVTTKVDPDDLTLKISGWMNANPRGAFNAPHTHPGAHWSGVYYVAQPSVDTGNSGMIEFLDPRSDLPNWRILRAKPFRPKRKIRPQAGEIVLFPSYLTHWVYPNEAEEERVTIAFNATFSKRRRKKG